MFTGIVQGKGQLTWIKKQPNMTHIGVRLPENLLNNINIGASISLDGTCLTVVKQEKNIIFFDIVSETLNRTTFSGVALNQIMNIERSLKMGDELGGHQLSGHIMGTAKLLDIRYPSEQQRILTFQCPEKWMSYILPKGYVAINGASLTVVDTDMAGKFSVHLIPETLAATNLSELKIQESVNIEIDYQTQAIVTTVENYLKNRT
tara:strand:- start:21904 stop:22518 length:615 start_codon:yes stop_codon:yes gene_type:complete